MELNQNQNNTIEEEKEYSTNSIYGKKKTLYIVNFTPLRLSIFSACSILLILFIFILGFHLGSSKPNNANSMANNENVIDDSSQILMRTEELTGNRNFENSNNDILTLSENTQNDSYNDYNNSSIIRESLSSEDRYNEYTQSLASELDAIIKEKDNFTLQAINYLKEKFNKRKIYLKYDLQKYDKNNNLMCYVYLDNKTFINNHLIRTGFVDVETNFDYSCKSKFIKSLPL